MHAYPKFLNSYGFTLTELVVYIGMSGLLTLGVMKLYVTNINVASSQRNTSEMFQNLRAAMSLMKSEIRRAGCDPLGTNKGRTVISDDYLGFLNHDDDQYNTDSNSIHFTQDIVSPADGWAYSENENVAYFKKNESGIKTLYRWCGISNKEYVVMRHIKSLNFNYYDSAGDEITISQDSDRANIRVVKITLVGLTEKPDPLMGEQKEQTLTAYVRVRNLNL